MHDLRLAARSLYRAKAFSVVAISLLALGIGASTAIFSVFSAMLLRPLPFARPGELVVIQTSIGARLSRGYLSEWRRRNNTLLDMAGWSDRRATMTGRGEPENVNVDWTTANLFRLLGVPPSLGRDFSDGTDLSQKRFEAILSDGLWRRRFGRDPSVLGTSIRLDGEPYTVIGVMPWQFAIRSNELAESQAEIWVSAPLAVTSYAGMGGDMNVVARLKPSVGVSAATADLGRIAGQLESEYPSYSRTWRVLVTPLHEATISGIKTRVTLVFWAVQLFLAVACISVANMVLSRNTGKSGEWAIRAALGGTPMRLLREVLIEALLVAALGTLLGICLGSWALQFLVSTLPPSLGLPRSKEMGVDYGVLAYAGVLGICVAIAAAVVPLLARVRRSGHVSLLYGASRSGGGGRPRRRVARALMVFEIALAFFLLAGTAILGKTLWNLVNIDPGFDTKDVISFRLSLLKTKYDSDDRVTTFVSELHAALAALPGVHSVGWADYLPLSNTLQAGSFDIVGRPTTEGQPPGSAMSVVGGDYFRTLGIHARVGSVFGPSFRVSDEPVVVIDEGLAQRYWPGQNPVGAKVAWPGDSGKAIGEIVGVVGSVKWRGLTAAPSPTAYRPFPQAPTRDLSWVARIDDRTNAVASIVRTIQAADSDLAVAELRPLSEVVNENIAQPRVTLVVVGSFGLAALLIAVVGVYGVLRAATFDRAKELAVRYALGATRADLVALLARDGVRMLVAGLAIGAAAAWVAGPMTEALLYNVKGRDPLSLLLAAVALIGVGVAAILLPAMKAAREFSTGATLNQQ
jgi:putative ABC transport system permease protein